MFCFRACIASMPHRVLLRNVRGLSASPRLLTDSGGNIRVHSEYDIAVITLDRGENRMNSEWLDQMNGALDEALRNSDLKGIITTGEGKKYYSNGLDLAYLMEQLQSNPDDLGKFVQQWQALLLRFVTCPVLTVAAINGHAYAGGGILSMCHDLRIMQNDRGYWCLNEAHLGIEFPEWFLRLFSLKVGGNGARGLVESVLCGRRFTAETAKERGIVDETCTSADLLTKATALVNHLVPGESPGREFVRKSKETMFKDVLTAAKQPYDLSKFFSYL